MTDYMEETFVGKVFDHIKVTRDSGEDNILFREKDTGRVWKMHHYQDCCECVTINEIIGDMADLVDTPILEAREDSKGGDLPYDASETWTFYNFRTIRGSVTIRWYGTSNGYYSESVSVDEVVNVDNLADQW